MAINKNHEFEDLDGVKCAVVEKNAGKDRVAFLKDLLEYNHYKVIVVPSPPPKVAPAPKPVDPSSPAKGAPLARRMLTTVTCGDPRAVGQGTSPA